MGVSRDEWAKRCQILGGEGGRLGEDRWICEAMGECVSGQKNVKVCRSGYEPKHF